MEPHQLASPHMQAADIILPEPTNPAQLKSNLCIAYLVVRRNEPAFLETFEQREGDRTNIETLITRPRP